MYTDVLRADASQNSLRYFSKRLEKLVLRLISGDLSVSYGRDIISLSSSDIVRVISEMKVRNKSELAIRNSVLEAVVQCERLHKMSGVICCLAFCEYLKQNSIDISEDLEKSSMLSRRSSYSQASNFLKKILSDASSQQIAFSAIKLAGSDGRIVVDATPASETYISSCTGYQFKVSSENTFVSACKIQKWNRDNVLCLIVDGVIERASELEKIMYRLSETKQPAIIIARGFNEEVVSTLTVNFMRQHLDIVPVCVPIDEYGISLMNDLAAVCGTDVVSSLKGELISQKSYEDLCVIKHVSLDMLSGNLILENESTKKKVYSHLTQIKKKLDKLREWNTEDTKALEDILEKRIMSLSGDSVKIKVGKGLGDKRGLVLDRIHFSILSFKDICKFGMIDVSKIDNDISASIKNIAKKIQVLHNNIPTLSFLTGVKQGHSLSMMMNRIGCIIYHDT